jgi:hypothetical protein
MAFGDLCCEASRDHQHNDECKGSEMGLELMARLLIVLGQLVLEPERLGAEPVVPSLQPRRQYGPEYSLCDRSHRLLGHGVHHAVIAAFDALVMVVARDQQGRTVVAIGKHSRSRNLSAVVDIVR